VTHPETLNKTAGFSAKTMHQNLIPILAQAPASGGFLAGLSKTLGDTSERKLRTLIKPFIQRTRPHRAPKTAHAEPGTLRDSFEKAKTVDRTG
jgi:hypothetical protein